MCHNCGTNSLPSPPPGICGCHAMLAAYPHIPGCTYLAGRMATGPSLPTTVGPTPVVTTPCQAGSAHSQITPAVQQGNPGSLLGLPNDAQGGVTSTSPMGSAGSLPVGPNGSQGLFPPTVPVVSASLGEITPTHAQAVATSVAKTPCSHDDLQLSRSSGMTSTVVDSPFSFTSSSSSLSTTNPNRLFTFSVNGQAGVSTAHKRSNSITPKLAPSQRKKRKMSHVSPLASPVEPTPSGPVQMDDVLVIDPTTTISDIPVQVTFPAPESVESSDEGGDSDVSTTLTACPILNCETSSRRTRFVRHAMVMHLPWYLIPNMACWECGIHFHRNVDLDRHWQDKHGNKPQYLNWGKHRFEDFFERMHSLLLYIAEKQKVGDLHGLLDLCRGMDAERTNSRLALYPEGLWETFMEYLNATPPQNGFRLDPINSLAGLLNWRYVLRLIADFTPSELKTVKGYMTRVVPMSELPSAPMPHAAGSASFAEATNVLSSQVPLPVPSCQVPIEVSGLENSKPFPENSGARRKEPSSLNLGALSKRSSPLISAAKPRKPRTMGSMTVLKGPRRTMGSVTTLEKRRPPGLLPGLLPHPTLKPPLPLPKTKQTVGRPSTARSVVVSHISPVLPAELDSNNWPVGFDEVDITPSSTCFLTDAHFHLDNLCEQMGHLPVLLSSVETRRGTPGVQRYELGKPQIPLGYAIACFMLSAHGGKGTVEIGSKQKDPRLKFSFSAHPCHIATMNASKRKTVATSVLDFSAIEGSVAVGEIGLDFCVQPEAHRQQQQAEFLLMLLQNMQLQESIKNLPLVLHVRDAEVGGLTASKKCIEILQKAKIPKDHKVYRHCFVGSVEEADLWLEHFPNTVFGLSTKVISAHGIHHQSPTVFRSLKLNQILIETDSPKLKFHPGDRTKTTPWSTYLTSWWLAAVRKDSLAHVLDAVGDTFLNFFSLSPPQVKR